MSDPVTGLNDRQDFFKALHQNVTHANENNGKLALLVIHINRFSRINQVNGFDGGDAALKYVAQKLKGIKREQDYIARISDTKFALVLNNILNKGHAQLAAHKIIRVLEVPVDFNDKQIKITVTIGISLCPSHSSVAGGLYKKTEEALKLARQHETSIGITPDNTGFEISDFWDIELGIEEALNDSQFQLYYQPKISLKTGNPIGAEALIRWIHPSRGMIRPDQFIPIAEQYNYIKPMTIWILNVALRESGEWPKSWGPLSISVNIPPELMNPELVDLVDNALNIWEPDNITLVLEILERSFAETGEDSFITFEALQNLGAEISIDDFGTGYSALSYFKSIPAKELKVDQSFVLKLLDEKGNLDIVKLIINLAHAFDMRVVAEGVEDYKSLKVLGELGCDYIQGYYIARPMPHSEFLQWLLDYQGIEKPEEEEEIILQERTEATADQIALVDDSDVWHELAGDLFDTNEAKPAEEKSTALTQEQAMEPLEKHQPDVDSKNNAIVTNGLLESEKKNKKIDELPVTEKQSEEIDEFSAADLMIDLELLPTSDSQETYLNPSSETVELVPSSDPNEIEMVLPEVLPEVSEQQQIVERERPVIPERKNKSEDEETTTEDELPNENDIDFGEPLI